jgi:hypothetical protein
VLSCLSGSSTVLSTRINFGLLPGVPPTGPTYFHSDSGVVTHLEYSIDKPVFLSKSILNSLPGPGSPVLPFIPGFPCKPLAPSLPRGIHSFKVYVVSE